MRFRPRLRITLLSSAILCGLGVATWATVTIQDPPASSRFLSRYVWSLKAPWFGGFSGLELSADGQSFIAITDSAHLVKGRLARRNGQITGVTLDEDSRLIGTDGAALRTSKEDSEGLALAADGTLFVSFEDKPHVARYPTPKPQTKSRRLPKILPRLDAFDHLHKNKAFEAIAIDGRNALFLLPERAPIGETELPVWRWDGESWQVFDSFPETKGFSPVGADFGPDGRLYILERQFLTIGFRSRLRRFDVSENGLGASELLFQTRIGTHDNLEGLAIWRDAAGMLRATMISDDNFFFLQHTEFVEYQLPD